MNSNKESNLCRGIDMNCPEQAFQAGNWVICEELNTSVACSVGFKILLVSNASTHPPTRAYL